MWGQSMLTPSSFSLPSRRLWEVVISIAADDVGNIYVGPKNRDNCF
jgi:hypothetical protein